MKSDTKGTFDFDISGSRYDYLEDIQRNPFSVVAGTATFTPYGKIQRMDGTNWMNGDAKAIWRPGDFHEVSFGLHGCTPPKPCKSGTVIVPPTARAAARALVKPGLPGV